MTLIVNPTPIHETIQDRKRKGSLCPDLIPVRWHSVIVVIENQGLASGRELLEMRHDKRRRVSLINLHFSPNTLGKSHPDSWHTPLRSTCWAKTDSLEIKVRKPQNNAGHMILSNFSQSVLVR